MVTTQQIRREAAKDQAAEASMVDNADFLDAKSSVGETAQEMSERMDAENASEETIDVLEGMKALQSGELVTWQIHRIAGPNGEPLRTGPSEYCGELGTSQMTQTNIASLWGGGKYRVRGRFHSGQFAGERRITIAADARRPGEGSVNQAPNFDMQGFMAQMQMMEQQRQERDENRRREERAEQQRRDDRIITLVGAGLPVIGSVLTAMITRQPPASQDLPALITALRPAVNPQSGVTQLKDMMEIVGMLRDQGGDSGSGTAQIIRAVADVGAPLLSMAASQMGARRRPQAAPGRVLQQPPMEVTVRPNPNAAPPVRPTAPTLPMDIPSTPVVNHATNPGVSTELPSSQNAAPPGGQDPAMFAELKAQVDALVEIATSGADPVITADMFYDQTLRQMPDAAYGQIADLIENVDFLKRIAIFNRNVNLHEPFFTAMRAQLVKRIVDADENPIIDA